MLRRLNRPFINTINTINAESNHPASHATFDPDWLGSVRSLLLNKSALALVVASLQRGTQMITKFAVFALLAQDYFWTEKHWKVWPASRFFGSD